MATVVLGAVGSYFGPIGGFIGSAIGSLIDSYFIMPALFPEKPLEGPRLDDRTVSLATEGSPANWVLGPRNRVVGTVIWMSDLIEEKNEESVGKGGGGSSVTTYRYFVDIAIAFCTTESLPNNRVNKIRRIWGNAKIIYGQSEQEEGRFESLKIYLGDQDPDVDPADDTMVAHLGAGNVPHYINTCFAVFHRLALEDFGNGVPSFSAEIEQDADISMAEAIELVLARSGFDPTEYNTDRVSSCFYGMIASGPQAGSNVLQPLLLSGVLGVQESDGQLVFFQRGQEELVPVDSGYFGAYEFGAEVREKLTIADPPDDDLPKEVNITFTATDNDLQQGSEREVRTTLLSDNVVQVDLPLTLVREDARALARKMVWAAEAERQSVEFQLPPSQIRVQEGDVVTTTIDGIDHEIFVKKITRGANGLLECAGVLTQRQVYTQDGVAQAGPTNSTTAPVGSNPTKFFVFDAAPFRDELATKIGVYFAICYENRAAVWRGAALYHSNEEETTFKRKANAPGEAIMGEVVVAPGSGRPFVKNEDSFLVVDLYNGELESCSETQWLRGEHNRCAVENSNGEWEVIGFQNVTQLSANRYRLSKLLRGLKGTEHCIEGTLPGGGFLLLQDTRVGFWARGGSAVHTNEFYKAPAMGGQISDYVARRARCEGRTMRPFSPSHISALVGPESREVWATSDDTAISVNTSRNCYEGPADFFSRFRGDVDRVTVAGWPTADNNGSFKIVRISSDGSRLYPETDLVAEPSPSSPSVVTFALGGDTDIVVTWKRRSKFSTSLFIGGPVADDENDLRFRVEARNGGVDGPLLREWTTDEEFVIYSQDKQIRDGLSGSFVVTFVVRQKSNRVAFSLPASVTVVVPVVP